MPRLDTTDIRFSGLETKGMKKLGSSLLLPVECKVEFKTLWLKPDSNLIVPDSEAPDRLVDFPGSGVVTMNCVDQQQNHRNVLIVAGKCRFNQADYKDFKHMLRAYKEARQQGLGRNSDLAWPNVEGFQLCPVCATQNQPGKRTKCYMVFSLLTQQVLSDKACAISYCRAFSGFRLCPQLVCVECFENIIASETFTDSNEVVASEINRMAGMPLYAWASASLAGVYVDSGKLLSAWPLYQKWTNTGIYHSLYNTIREREAELLLVGVGKEVLKEADASATDCLLCKTKLGSSNVLECSKCKIAVYCSEECQKKDWKRHQLIDCVDMKVKQPFFFCKDSDDKNPHFRCCESLFPKT